MMIPRCARDKGAKPKSQITQIDSDYTEKRCADYAIDTTDSFA